MTRTVDLESKPDLGQLPDDVAATCEPIALCRQGRELAIMELSGKRGHPEGF
ncbi:MAG: hypothetical protein ACKVVT_04500 [Dehalococcoidia bacterium]